MTTPNGKNVSQQLRSVYFLTQILNTKVILKGKEIGTLDDVAIADSDKLAEVTHFLVARSFGRPPLLIPLEKVLSMNAKQVAVDLENVEAYQEQPKPDMVLLKDHVLDKKVLDMEDREVEIVYDVKMTLINNKLYVTDVDLSKYGLLRRMGMKWLADMIYRPKTHPNQEIIPWKYVQHLPTDISSFKGELKLNILKERLHDIPAVDLADILEEMDPNQRAAVFGELNTEHASDTLEEIDPNVQRELAATLKKDRMAQLINEMTPAQAADVLSALPGDTADDIIPLLDKNKAKKIQSIMEKQETKIMDFSTMEFLRFGPEVAVARVEEEYPKVSRGKDLSNYIYVVGDDDKLLGVVDLKDLLLADDSLLLKEIMDDQIMSLEPTDTVKHAYKMFKRYGLGALPIVDNENKILGVVPYRDVMNLRHKLL